jgi:glycosyltransferase involved in cell wall biosynthesis
VIKKPSVLVVASPTLRGTGGNFRAFRSIEEYSRFFDTYLFIPWELWSDKKFLLDSSKYLLHLRNLGVKFSGYSYISDILYKLRKFIGTKFFELIVPMVFSGIAKLNVALSNYDATVVLHESWDAVYSGTVLSKLFNTPSIAFLQLPPFYGSKERFQNILKALLLWRRLRSSSFWEEILFQMEGVSRDVSLNYIQKKRYKNILTKYTVILGISKAIPLEMGSEWVNRVTSLDPGVSLTDDEQKTIMYIKSRTNEKKNYLIFGGRPDAYKGLPEALLVFKQISKIYSDLKFVVTGYVEAKTLAILKRVTRKLGIDNKVVFSGFVSREKRLKLVADAKLMIYPSHVDSFSYAVLESLYLGTPVVAYDIPAIRIYYGRSPGVELIKEWSLEEMTIKALDLLEHKMVDVKPPKIKSWEEIMSEEINIINKLVVSK